MNFSSHQPESQKRPAKTDRPQRKVQHLYILSHPARNPSRDYLRPTNDDGYERRLRGSGRAFSCPQKLCLRVICRFASSSRRRALRFIFRRERGLRRCEPERDASAAGVSETRLAGIFILLLERTPVRRRSYYFACHDSFTADCLHGPLPNWNSTMRVSLPRRRLSPVRRVIVPSGSRQLTAA